MQTFNRLILGDNLEVLKSLDAESVDLIYLDPPFFSNRNYEVIWGDRGEVRSFEDRFSGGIDHYISWLYDRVQEPHRVLKSTGSIYLHCDHHADSYIRVFILDKIFGQSNFRNEIVWKRLTSVKSQTKGSFTISDDKIFFYTKSNGYTFNKQFGEYGENYIKQFYKYEDKDGRKYRLSDFAQQGQGEPRNFGDKHGFIAPPKGKHWIWTQEKIDDALKNNLLVFSKNGNPRVKRFLDEKKGMPLTNIWDDIFVLQGSSKESIGYPTQKPEALLSRIIKASSNEGDVVLDPFCGGDTALAVADRLGRGWIGIDQSVAAIKVSEARLTKNTAALKKQSPVTAHEGRTGGDLFSDARKFTVELHKYDFETLRYSDAFEFESFIVRAAGGEANQRQRGDRGIDGHFRDGAPIQVKRSEGVGTPVLNAFLGAIQMNDKAAFDKAVSEKRRAGAIIAFSFGKGIVQEAARLRLEQGVVIELLKVGDIVPIAQKPKISLSVEGGRNERGTWALPFCASVQSESPVEIFQWDFAFDEERGFAAEVLNDKAGRQSRKFVAGAHCVAVKAIDANGIDSTEKLKFHLNGKIEVG